MELHRAYIVHVSLQSEHALFDFVIPNFNEVIVATTDKHRLCLVEVDSSDGT